MGDTSDIKIFVSHRIDKDTEIIDSPLYYNIRCGAVYDKREKVEILGDNVGENISEKRNSFCELTVMYWAWKNMQADYYGLCHYRRYLSFAEHSANIIEKNYIDSKLISEYKLNDINALKNLVNKYDILACYPENVKNEINLQQESVYDMCKNRIGDYDINGVKETLNLIQKRWPQYYTDALEYFHAPYAQFYNCFIMKKEYFNQMCTFVFDVLFELEKKLDTQYYNESNNRMPGFMGEHLIGRFYHFLKKRKVKIKYLDLVYIHKPEKTPALEPAFEEKNVPIVCMCSNYYVPYFAILLQSLIMVMSVENNYDIIILTKGVDIQKQRDLQKMVCEFKNISLRFVSPHKEFDGTHLYIASTCYSDEAYYRVLVPWILAKYKRAITLDCDLIFQKDPKKLLTIDFAENECIAGAKDVAYQGWFKTDKKQQEYANKTLKLSDPYNYVNTGVLVMDLVKIRNLITKDEMLKFILNNKFQIQEQDALNVIFEKNFKYIDIKWNYYVEVNPTIAYWIKNAPLKYKEQYEQAGKQPYIVHYASNPKPWDMPEIPYASLFWRIARTTPYYEQLLYRSMRGLASLEPKKSKNISFKKMCDALLPIGSVRRKVISRAMKCNQTIFGMISGKYNQA